MMSIILTIIKKYNTSKSTACYVNSIIRLKGYSTN